MLQPMQEVLMFKQNYLIFIGFAIGVVGWLLLSGCSGTTPYSKESAVYQNWGKSFETAKYNQLLDPDAYKNLKPVEGLDGTAGHHNVNKYKESFKKDEPKESVTILKLQ
jgi:hypothetical protein